MSTPSARRRRKRLHPRRWVRVLRGVLAAIARQYGGGRAPLDDVEPLRAAVRALPARSGVCRVCGCTFARPCADGHVGCSWVDRRRTLCSVCARTLMEGL